LFLSSWISFCFIATQKTTVTEIENERYSGNTLDRDLLLELGLDAGEEVAGGDKVTGLNFAGLVRGMEGPEGDLCEGKVLEAKGNEDEGEEERDGEGDVAQVDDEAKGDPECLEPEPLAAAVPNPLDLPAKGEGHGHGGLDQLCGSRPSDDREGEQEGEGEVNTEHDQAATTEEPQEVEGQRDDIHRGFHLREVRHRGLLLLLLVRGRVLELDCRGGNGGLPVSDEGVGLGVNVSGRG